MVENPQSNQDSGALGYITTRIEYNDRYGPPIDLGLGESPLGAAPELERPLAMRNPFHDLAHYSRDPLHRISSRILIDGIGLRDMPLESILFNGNGSYGAGDEVLRYLTLIGYKPFFVPTYSFPNVKQWAIRHGNQYYPVPASELSPDKALEAILAIPPAQLKKAIVYIDYPNNPFGYANPELMRELIHYVASSGAIPVVDMAFGEVLGDEFREALQFNYENGGIGLASLTKTQGLAKVRLGYAILPARLTQDGYSDEQRMVFGVNDEAESALQYLFKPNGLVTLARQHADRVAKHNFETNDRLYEALTSLGLMVGPTDQRTHIQTVISNFPDLYQRLSTHGIISESLHDYRGTLNSQNGYGHSAVRMLTPRPGELQRVIERVSLALSS